MAEAIPGVHLYAKVGNENIKLLSAALHLLQKVGKELIIETESGAIVFRSLNDPKSAFISVEFDKDFFEKFTTAVGGDGFSCKVAIKPICAILRNLKTTQNLIIRAQFSAKVGHELIFEMLVSNGITRTHRFHYSDCEIMSAIFDEQSASHIRCEPKVFTQLLDHFYHSPEISIEASQNSFQVKSFHQEQNLDSTSAGGRGSNAMKHMTTELAVNIGEFDEYDFVDCINSDTADQGGAGDGCEELVVCSKELRAMLNYCEVTETPFFYFFFTTGGRPIKLSTGADSRDGSVKVDLVLATLETRNRGGPRGSQQQQQQHQDPPSQAMGAGNAHVRLEDSSTYLGPPHRSSQTGQGSQRFLRREDDTAPSSPQMGYRGDAEHPRGGRATEPPADSPATAKPSKRRPKRMLDSSSDEEDGQERH